MTQIVFAAVGIVFLVTTAFTNEPSRDWPRWRGPKADGIADNGKLPTQWSPSENIRWSVKLPLGNEFAGRLRKPCIPHAAHGESFNRVGIAPRVSDSSRSKLAGRCPRG